MKRFFTMIVAACAFFAISAANPMVTLSHNGKLSFFTNIGAFKAAYDVAEHGDIIYLSEGDFILDGGKCTIKKRLSIIGNGYGSHIVGDIDVSISESTIQMDTPLFDGVKLDDLSFDIYSNHYKNLGETEIRRTWIRNLTGGSYAGTDILYENCVIENGDFYGDGNVLIKNSKLGKIDGRNTYDLTVVNCNIDYLNYYPRYMASSILNNESTCSSNGKCSIFNSLFRYDHQDYNLTTYDCYLKTDSSLLDDKLETTVDLAANGYFGTDGEVVGIHGGESHFSENPSVPTVDTANSSVEYDAENNKLKVSITVKAD